MMRQSLGCAPVFLAVSACVSLCSNVVGNLDERHSDGIMLEQVQIFVNILGGPTFSLLVEPNETGWGLRSDINEIEGIPYDYILLGMGNTLLDNTRRLSEYNIRENATLTLEIPVHESLRPVKFIVKTPDGRELQVSTRLDNTVARLKENITQWTGIPLVEQRLLLAGKELKDERKLALYEINNGTTIDLGGPLENCRREVRIYIETLSVAKIELVVNLADRVADLKEKIWERTGVPCYVQRLSANRRTIAGDGHLCDLGLGARSTVYMFLYSSRITSPDQVARLQEPPVKRLVNPLRAPIFREVEEDAAEPVQSGRPVVSIYKDARNWLTRGLPGLGWSPRDYDPVAYLSPNPDDVMAIQQYRKQAAALSNDIESQRLEAEIICAHVKFSSAVSPYRKAANLASFNHFARHHSGISLAGGSTYVSSKQLVSLGADVNNWAPDAFSDADVIRLFELSERARLVLAREPPTGEKIFWAMARQKRTNRMILLTYLAALACYPPSAVYDRAREGEECGICRDDLTIEPAVKLACEHTYHADCLQSWATNSYDRHRFPDCPACRQRFMFSYEILGKAELEILELQSNLDK